LNEALERILAAVLPGEAGGAPFDSLVLSSRYQPIFSSAEQRPFGYEGLLVSYTADGKAVAPHRVFDRADARGQGVYLDWLSRALHLRNWRQLGEARGLLFLNVSPTAAIEDAHFERVFPSLLAAYEVNPADVVVEILETGVEEEPQLVAAVAMYRALGCKVALDDFGAGASEMKRFWRLRPDIVKIDRSLVRGCAFDRGNTALLRALVAYTEEMGLEVCAEGVEDAADLRQLVNLGVRHAQGYLLGRPDPAWSGGVAAPVTLPAAG